MIAIHGHICRQGETFACVEYKELEAMNDELNKLRGKLRRADKKIKTDIASFDELHQFIQEMQNGGDEMHIYKALLDERFSHRMTKDALKRANLNIVEKIGAIDSLHGYKMRYETGAKIRRGLAATIIEKDKSIGELVDRVNDECEKNENLSAVAHRYAGKLLTNEFRIDGLENEIAELRDKYEPKLVRCDKFKSCRAFGCYHWSPHQPNHVCGAYACCDHNCIQWRGDV